MTRHNFIFKNLDQTTIDNLISKNYSRKKSYRSREIIALEGDPLKGLGIILTGKIEVAKVFPSGRKLVLSNFGAGNIFGESMVFKDEAYYPSTIEALEDSQILFIAKENLFDFLRSDDNLMKNYLNLLSSRILMLNDKLDILTQDSIRRKIVSFLIKESHKTRSNHIRFEYNRNKMSEILNIPRPSLSRELNRMADDTLIYIKGQDIVILDEDLLFEELY